VWGWGGVWGRSSCSALTPSPQPAAPAPTPTSNTHIPPPTFTTPYHDVTATIGVRPPPAVHFSVPGRPVLPLLFHHSFSQQWGFDPSNTCTSLKYHALGMCCQLYNRLTVTELPVYVPGKDEVQGTAGHGVGLCAGGGGGAMAGLGTGWVGARVDPM
jgi:hypothetical protein